MAESQAKTEAREVAVAVNKANTQFQFALNAMWDARERGNQEDFIFFRSAMERSAKALLEWSAKLAVKQ